MRSAKWPHRRRNEASQRRSRGRPPILITSCGSRRPSAPHTSPSVRPLHRPLRRSRSRASADVPCRTGKPRGSPSRPVANSGPFRRRISAGVTRPARSVNDTLSILIAIISAHAVKPARRFPAPSPCDSPPIRHTHRRHETSLAITAA